MRMRCFFTSVLVSLLTITPASADIATSLGAKALSDAAAAYFSKSAIDQGIIRITPQGDGYLTTLEFQRAIDALGAPAGSLQVGRWSFLMTPMADRTWKISADNFPAVTFSIAAPTGQSMDRCW